MANGTTLKRKQGQDAIPSIPTKQVFYPSVFKATAKACSDITWILGMARWIFQVQQFHGQFTKRWNKNASWLTLMVNCRRLCLNIQNWFISDNDNDTNNCVLSGLLKHDNDDDDEDDCCYDDDKQWVLHSWKLTCPPKRDYFNRKYIFQLLVFRGYVSFRGSTSF